MMPRWRPISVALISGTTSGTSFAMRKADELSMTMAPAATAAGANRVAVALPTENKAAAGEAFLAERGNGVRHAHEVEPLAGRARRGEEA